MARMLAIMAPASLSLLPLVFRSSPALASSSAFILSLLVNKSFILLIHINSSPVARIFHGGKTEGILNLDIHGQRTF